MPPRIDISGNKFGRLTAVSFIQRTTAGTMWSFVCDCGNSHVTAAANVMTGKTQSCGCYHAIAITKHGKSRTKAYKTWSSMLGRTTNPLNKDWKYYGGRGIAVCERWTKFENFYADMGDPPDDLTIDRIDVDGNYEPANCRWVDRATQTANRRTKAA